MSIMIGFFFVLFVCFFKIESMQSFPSPLRSISSCRECFVSRLVLAPLLTGVALALVARERLLGPGSG